MEQDQINAQLRAMIDGAFDQPIKPQPKPLRYYRSILLTTIATLLLPILYCSLIAAIGYGIYEYDNWRHDFFQSHAPFNTQHHHAPVPIPFHVPSNMRNNHTHERINLDNEIWLPERQFLFLFIPPILGIVAELFLLRSFIPKRRPKGAPLYEITPQTEPVFDYFIKRLCRYIYVPVPRHIELVMEPKVSVTFRRGIISFFSTDLTLAIGLPLISSLTTRQLAGLLAHELGHFQQGIGARLLYLISSIQNWFYSRVHDEAIDEEEDIDYSKDDYYWSRITWHSRIRVFTIIIRLCLLWIRGVLWVFWAIGSLMNVPLSRQVEYQADQLQIKVAGSHEFESILYILNAINTSYRKAYRMNEWSREKQMAVENLPALVKAEALDLLNLKKKDIMESLLDNQTKMLDMEPCQKDRIVNARQQNLHGICSINVASKVLFVNFTALCKILTQAFFEEQFKRDLTNIRLLPIEEYKESVESAKLSERKTNRQAKKNSYR